MQHYILALGISQDKVDELMSIVVAILVLLLSQVLQELRAKKRHNNTIETIKKNGFHSSEDKNDA